MAKEIKNRKEEIFYQTSGVVKSYNRETGYGFLFTVDEPDTDIYFHFTSIMMEGKKELNVGDKVEFLYKNYGDKGLRAYTVTLVK